ncbi:glycoside hydrolase family 27 protein [Salegentibacter sp. F188]|uniref:Alpha-galactosidase n=1 Tax=Autumnicola patrickiae TaxID=3075591 RepID=A0ABU3DZY2_9FLAO|nr:glycoside hydrolase family 27 protein [Salegentibacter sp. F188]MDT0688979.1 glycoside hydrolase family 27 protein [Salegentibacter sp. F188]
MKNKIASLLCLLIGLSGYSQKFEGLADTPPMGWNTWNTFACDINEDLIKETADAIVASGMKEAGYEYVIIDDCWHGERDEKGFIQVDPERFPSGMKALADYVHSKGLKIGIYSDAGTQTCAGEPGSRGYEYQDAIRYAEWGIDYLKYDWCNTENINPIGAYTTMRDALYSAGRPVLFAMCEWGDNQPWEWAEDVAHMWRTTGDIYNCWNCEEDHGSWSSWGVLRILDMQDGLRKYAGPGHWNDPDMMEVGNGMSQSEDRAHFTMWSMLAAPLIAGNDVRNMTPETIEILTNKKMIAINQDSLGVQAFKYNSEDGLETWFKPLSNGEWAVTFLNRSDEPEKVNFDWESKKIEDPHFDYAVDFSEVTYSIEDIWNEKELKNTKKTLKATVAPHDVLTLRLKKN